MLNQTPSLSRILVMVAFALSCFGILLYLWISFGGSLPLKPQSYRFKAALPEATALVREADVRIAGVNVGRVKTQQYEAGSTSQIVEMELEPRFAPIPEDTRAILRQKSLLGETYIELTPGSPSAPKLDENELLTRNNVEATTELDEIQRVFDPETKRAFRSWVNATGEGIRAGTGENLNDALGNLPGFARDGADVLTVLDEQDQALRQFISNSGEVFGALSERRGQLRSLIVNSNRVFSATAAEKEALAETFQELPGFLDESRRTLVRLEEFARDTDPLITDLKPVAEDLGPTIRDLGALAPDLEQLLRDLRPLIAESRATLPQAARYLRGLRQVTAGIRTFFPELNPLLSFLNFNQEAIAMFLREGGGASNYQLPAGDAPGGREGKMGALAQIALINDETLGTNNKRRSDDRGNAYPAPNAYRRAQSFGTIESFDCKQPDGPGRGGPQRDPDPTNGGGAPPCFVAPPSLFNGKQFPQPQRGVTPRRQAPKASEGIRPARP
jgi:virulence factor Mce-like protein